MDSVEAIEIYPQSKNDDTSAAAELAELAEQEEKEIEEAKEQLLRVCKTVIEMLQDRNYTVDPFNRDTFIDQHFPNGYDRKVCVYILGTKQGETDKILVMVCQTSLDAINIIEELKKAQGAYASNQGQEAIGDVYNIQEFEKKIVVAPAARAMTIRSLNVNNVTFFLYKELLINITHHMLVPRFYVLTEAEKKEFLECYKLSVSQLPKMLEADPISKYYGLKKGDVVKITRKSVTAGRYVYYRCVI